jgi:hypothetical protein
LSQLIIWFSPLISVLSLALSVWNTHQLRRRDYREQAEQITAWLVPYPGPQDEDHGTKEGIYVANASK